MSPESLTRRERRRLRHDPVNLLQPKSLLQQFGSPMKVDCGHGTHASSVPHSGSDHTVLASPRKTNATQQALELHPLCNSWLSCKRNSS